MSDERGPAGGGEPVVDVRGARIVIEVTAGVVPGVAEQDFTRRYVVDSGQWARALNSGDAHTAVGRLLSETNGRALGYAGMLMLQPERLNWVHTEWIYL